MPKYTAAQWAAWNKKKAERSNKSKVGRKPYTRYRKPSNIVPTHRWHVPRAGAFPMLASVPGKRALDEIMARKCGAHYKVACRDPFLPNARGACVPGLPVRESYKYTMKATGVVHLNAAGVGALLVTPCAASDEVSVFASSATNTLTSDITPVVQDGGFTKVNASGPFIKSQLLGSQDGNKSTPPLASVRIVSVGCRIRYIGRQDMMMGTNTAYVSPMHSNMNGVSMAEVNSRSEASIAATDREWHAVTLIGASRRELEYTEARELHDTFDAMKESLRLLYPYANDQPIHAEAVATGVGAAMAGFWISAHANATFQFEYIAHCEAVGEACASNTTRNAANPQAMTDAQNSHKPTKKGGGGGA